MAKRNKEICRIGEEREMDLLLSTGNTVEIILNTSDGKNMTAGENIILALHGKIRVTELPAISLVILNFLLTFICNVFNFNSIILSVYFLNIRVSQLTKRIQDLHKDGDMARLRMYGTLLP